MHHYVISIAKRNSVGQGKFVKILGRRRWPLPEVYCYCERSRNLCMVCASTVKALQWCSMMNVTNVHKEHTVGVGGSEMSRGRGDTFIAIMATECTGYTQDTVLGPGKSWVTICRMIHVRNVCLLAVNIINLNSCLFICLYRSAAHLLAALCPGRVPVFSRFHSTEHIFWHI